MLAPMIFVLGLAVVAGALASRSIVAAADAHRFGEDDRWVDPRCSACRHSKLSLTMLRCRSAAHPQRFANAVVTIATISLGVGMAFTVPSLWLWPAYAVFAATLVLLTVTDLDTFLIPNRMLGPGIVVGSLLLVGGWALDTTTGSVLRAVAAAVAYFFVMYVLALLARGGLGFGDVKLAFLIGLFTGYLSWGYVLIAGVGSFLVGGLVSLILITTKRRGRKDAVPFGPFMVIAGLVAVFWGQAIIDWYVG